MRTKAMKTRTKDDTRRYVLCMYMLIERSEPRVVVNTYTSVFTFTLNNIIISNVSLFPSLPTLFRLKNWPTYYLFPSFQRERKSSCHTIKVNSILRSCQNTRILPIHLLPVSSSRWKMRGNYIEWTFWIHNFKSPQTLKLSLTASQVNILCVCQLSLLLRMVMAAAPVYKEKTKSQFTSSCSALTFKLVIIIIIQKLYIAKCVDFRIVDVETYFLFSIIQVRIRSTYCLLFITVPVKVWSQNVNDNDMNFLRNWKLNTSCRK